MNNCVLKSILLVITHKTVLNSMYVVWRQAWNHNQIWLPSVKKRASCIHPALGRLTLYFVFLFFVYLQCNPVSSLFYISSYTRNIKTLCTVMRAISSLRDIKMRVLVSSFFINSFFVLSVESSRVFTRLCLRVVDWVTTFFVSYFFHTSSIVLFFRNLN